jgi:hypothetical protein
VWYPYNTSTMWCLYLVLSPVQYAGRFKFRDEIFVVIHVAYYTLSNPIFKRCEEHPGWLSPMFSAVPEHTPPDLSKLALWTTHNSVRPVGLLCMYVAQYSFPGPADRILAIHFARNSPIL